MIDNYRTSDLLGELNSVEMKYAPEVLYALGDPDLLRNSPAVSIIGSRKASRDGLARAATLAKKLVARGVTIVSGLAEGIDTAAHWSAIKNNGRTVAVLGNPLSKYYPKSNKQLQDVIASEHLLISQFAEGSRGGKHCFPIRNRTMALLSGATVIVEAAEKSGTIHQGWEALRLRRPLFIMESLVDNHELTWPKKFMEYGAEALTQEKIDLLLEMLPTGRYASASELEL